MKYILYHKEYVSQLLLSLIVFIISKIILLFVLVDIDLIYVHLDCWIRGDSIHYLDIASKGYEFFSCAGHFGYPLDAKEFCGNTGWFPGYSMMIKLVSYFTNNHQLSAVIISNLFLYLSLFITLVIVNKSNFSIKTIAYLCLGAFFFGFIYYHAVFPISMVVFFMLLSIYFFSKGNIILSAIACMLVSFTYPSGFLLAIALAISQLFDESSNFKRNLFRVLLIGGIGFIGVFICFLIFQLKFDDWQAFIKVQAKYKHELRNPLENMYNYLKSFNKDILVNKNVIIAQSLFVIIAYAGLTYYFFSRKRHKTRIDLSVFICTTLFFIFPWLVGGDLSVYRSEALLFPAIILIRDLKTDYITALLSILLFIGIPMSVLFFRNVLI